jgi:CheY-like chemotaxis protein
MNKTRVLVADDEPGILEIIKTMLEPHGFAVTTVLSAKAALDEVLKAKSESNLFQLVITDIRMPGMSGLGLLSSLKSMQPDLPVIAITAYQTEDLPEQLERCGCRLWIYKPFKQKQLLDAIDTVLVRPQNTVV